MGNWNMGLYQLGQRLGGTYLGSGAIPTPCCCWSTGAACWPSTDMRSRG